MKYDPIVLSKLAKELGVIRNTLEKVIRLAEILKFANEDNLLKGKLALKGGTAINIIYSELPRLSVDIDFDYTQNETKKEMLISRKKISRALENHFIEQEYTLSKNSRHSLALDSFSVIYTPSGGGLDSIKIEINYVMRCHIMPLEQKELNLNFLPSPFNVLTVSKEELYAGKIHALLTRNQIRDLYDVYHLVAYRLLSEKEISVLKNILLFYNFIQSDTFFFKLNLDEKYTHRNLIRDLLPVIRKKDDFKLEIAVPAVTKFVSSLVDYDCNQKLFIKSVEDISPNFEYLFENEEMRQFAGEHPLTIWKILKTKEKK